MDSKSKAEYNDEPVYYCKSCLSLRIRTLPDLNNQMFCDVCGCTDIAESSIEEWE